MIVNVSGQGIQCEPADRKKRQAIRDIAAARRCVRTTWCTICCRGNALRLPSKFATSEESSTSSAERQSCGRGVGTYTAGGIPTEQ